MRPNQLPNSVFVVGGMPAAVQTYLDTENIGEVVKVQKAILAEYRKDAAKYDRKYKLEIVRTLDLMPEELNDKNKRFLIADLKDRGRFDRLKDNLGTSSKCSGMKMWYNTKTMLKGICKDARKS